MNPTAWNTLFNGEQLPAEASRRLRRTQAMEALHRKLRAFSDLSLEDSAENAVKEALRHALDIPLLEVLAAAWRRHPEFPAAQRRAQESDRIVLFGVGEHDVVSTHQPRIEVDGPKGTLVSFELDLRLELTVQSGTLWIEKDDVPTHASVGVCRGVAQLRLEDQELAVTVREDIRFPEEGLALVPDRV